MNLKTKHCDLSKYHESKHTRSNRKIYILLTFVILVRVYNSVAKHNNNILVTSLQGLYLLFALLGVILGKRRMQLNNIRKARQNLSKKWNLEDRKDKPNSFIK